MIGKARSGRTDPPAKMRPFRPNTTAKPPRLPRPRPLTDLHGRPARALFAALALGAWAWSAGSSLMAAYGGALALKPWAQGLCNAAFFAATLLFFRSVAREEPAREPETRLGGLVLGGLLTLSGVLVSLLALWWADGELGYFMAEGWPVLMALPVIAYLCWTFVKLRGLIDERTRATRSAWKAFFVFLLLAASSAVVVWPEAARFAFAGIGALLAFSLIPRVKWIAELKPAGRLFTLFYLLLLGWVHGVMLLKFLQDPFPDVFHSAATANLFPLLLAGFNAAYVAMSLLALLFNWPIHAVIERRARDLEGFEFLFEQSARGNIREHELQRHLFDLALQRSGASAGFRSKPYQHGNRVMHLREGDIRIEEISQWESALQRNGFSQALGEQQFVYVRDTRRHGGLADMGDRYRTALAFHLLVNGEDEGYLVLLHEDVDAFDERTIRVLHNFVKQSLLAEEKNRLVDQAVENERMKNEFAIATRIQESLLPQALPQPSWADLAVTYRPALLVGGDFYDVFDGGEDALHVVLGDVTGKGLGAAFNVAELKGIFHSNVDFLDRPEEFVGRVNRAVSACFAPEVFATMVYVGFQPKENRFTMARAGHCLPLLFHAETGEAEWLEGGFPGLGMERSDLFGRMVQVSRHAFRPNDLLVLYTDGIIEAERPGADDDDDTDERFYGDDRLLQVVRRSAFFDAEQIRNSILTDVQRFQEGGPVSDDLTLLVVKFT